VIAYNFPGFHPSPWMEARFGKGWSEFDVLKNARGLFPGHAMPRIPLWGYFNEADPEWAQREIDTAADYGLDGWMIDWYWHEGTMFYHEQLERGFLRAANNGRLKFALMWANHDRKNVYPARDPQTAAILLPQTHSVADCLKVADYCIEHYFHAPNYLRVNGALLFGFFDFPLLLKQLGEDGVARALDGMRERVQRAGLGEVHFQWNHANAPMVKDLAKHGINSATQYHTFGWTYGGRPAGGRSPYGDACAVTIRGWKEIRAASSVPFYPDCPVGWDDSPRFGHGAHVVTGRTPDQYERLCRAARHFVEGEKHKTVFLSAWNEWTEDHCLLPDMLQGYGFLEAVRRAFRA
jgi:hypothetical protein